MKHIHFIQKTKRKFISSILINPVYLDIRLQTVNGLYSSLVSFDSSAIMPRILAVGIWFTFEMWNANEDQKNFFPPRKAKTCKYIYRSPKHMRTQCAVVILCQICNFTFVQIPNSRFRRQVWCRATFCFRNCG